MPTYDYVCDACEHAFEEFQMMSAKVLKKCPACGKAKLRRLIGTGAGVIFKGGGFYETDYRSEAYQKDAKADKPAEKKTEGASDSSGGKAKKADGKPGAKAEKPAAKPTAKPASKPAATKPTQKKD